MVYTMEVAAIVATMVSRRVNVMAWFINAVDICNNGSERMHKTQHLLAIRPTMQIGLILFPLLKNNFCQTHLIFTSIYSIKWDNRFSSSSPSSFSLYGRKEPSVRRTFLGRTIWIFVLREVFNSETHSWPLIPLLRTWYLIVLPTTLPRYFIFDPMIRLGVFVDHDQANQYFWNKIPFG